MQKVNILFNKIKSLYSGKARKQIQNKKILSMENASQRFEHIYKKLWSSKESISGTGSPLDFTKNIRLHLPPKIFTKFNISSILDTPCGDFHWMQHVLKNHNEIDYIGGDIVNMLFLENNKKYASNHISFIILDIT